MSEQEGSKFKNIIAIAGFIILLAIGVWSAIQVVTFVPRLFSDTGVSADSRKEQNVDLDGRDIAVAMSDNPVVSGEVVTLSWARAGATDTGVLSFSYACDEYIHFQANERVLPCNAPYTLPTASTALDVTPVTTRARAEAPFAITYTNAAGESIRDTKTLTIVNPSAEQDVSDTEDNGELSESGEHTDGTTGGPIEPESVVPPAQDTAQTPTRTSQKSPRTVTQTIRIPRASNPYGTADLHVEIIGIGDVNPYGVFEPKSVVHRNALGAAKIQVTNTGDKTTGQWYFSAILPTRGGYPFTSNLQPHLTPGASTEILITFDQLVPGTHVFSTRIDPHNHIPELSEYNNSASQLLTVLNY